VVLGILAVVVVGTSADLRIVGGGVGAPASSVSVLAAAGILFVAFAGYARITVLGEEVRDPVRTIPRAMVMSFAVVIVVYAVLAFAVLLAVNAGVTLSDAPLESMAKALDSPALVTAVRIGAVIAAGGALLSLIAGIGRTLFAMGRGGDAPRALSVVGERTRVPSRAAITAAVLTAMVVVVGGIAFALALSAASILTYYAIAHLAVLARVRTGDARRGLGLTSGLGLIGCGALVAGLVVTALA
jgi:basic amino acid/polyamine antiporter, APA family